MICSTSSIFLKFRRPCHWNCRRWNFVVPVTGQITFKLVRWNSTISAKKLVHNQFEPPLLSITPTRRTRPVKRFLRMDVDWAASNRVRPTTMKNVQQTCRTKSKTISKTTHEPSHTWLRDFKRQGTVVGVVERFNVPGRLHSYSLPTRVRMSRTAVWVTGLVHFPKSSGYPQVGRASLLKPIWFVENEMLPTSNQTAQNFSMTA